MAKRYVKTRPYRPSNGTEGDWFERDWCGTCARNGENGCIIHFKTLCNDTEAGEYPEEWVKDVDDHSPYSPSFSARCTAHVCAIPDEVAAKLGVDSKTGQSLKR